MAVPGANPARAFAVIAAACATVFCSASSASEARHVPRPIPWFPHDMRLNGPIPSDAAVDDRSPAMIRLLVATKPRLPIQVRKWTVPVFHATAATQRFNVRLLASWADGKTMLGVPIPANAAPDPMADGHMAVLDRANGCVYEFYQAKKLANGQWTATWANSKKERTGLAIYPGGDSARASGFSAIAGLVRPEELRAGVIRHALTFAYRNTRTGGPVPPATGGDGWNKDPNAIPIGARVQLDPHFRVAALQTRWQRIVAHALQRYGMYLVDTGGDAGLWAQSPLGFRTNPYPWPAADFVFLPDSVTRALRVLRLRPQYHPPRPPRQRTRTCARTR
jgi:hypothetical protein